MPPQKMIFCEEKRKKCRHSLKRYEGALRKKPESHIFLKRSVLSYDPPSKQYCSSAVLKKNREDVYTARVILSHFFNHPFKGIFYD
jgi:hypothetical protein